MTNLYILHAMTEGDRVDARRMRFASTHESFKAPASSRQMAINHRMRAGIGLTPGEYALLWEPLDFVPRLA